MAGLAADVPKTDRELLLISIEKLDNLTEKIQGCDGKGGICAKIDGHEERLNGLENWRWYAIGIASLAAMLLSVFAKSFI